MIEFDQEKEVEVRSVASIKVIGIGGAGGNTVNHMVENDYQDVEFVVANTDAQSLERSQATHRIQVGLKSTKGLGTGADPVLGKRAAEEDLDKFMDIVGDADIVFLTAGMGGGTGSGGLPVIARALREKGVLTIAIVTKPFQFEGRRRASIAEEAIEQVRAEVDTLIVIPNQKLLDVVEEGVSMLDAFAMINDVLGHSVKGISDIITRSGHINVDFADVRSVMKDMGLAVMGTGRATGKERARDAALEAISSTLLENVDITGAHSVLLTITGGHNLSLHEIGQAASVIYDQADDNANIILGSVIDPALTEEVVVTVIATGFGKQSGDECTHKPVHEWSGSTVKPAGKAVEEAQQSPQQEVEVPRYHERRQQEHARQEHAHEHREAVEHKKDLQDGTPEVREDRAVGDHSEQSVQHTSSTEHHALRAVEDELDIPTFMRKKAEQSQSSE